MNIELIESNFIFSLYKDTDIFLDFISKVDPIKHFTNEESVFFFTMGRDLIKSGYLVIDQVAIETFLDTKPNLKSMYIKYGGWREISTIMNIVEEKNVYKYWDEIIKLNMFRNLEKHGVVVDKAKFLNATSEEVYAFYEYILNDSMISNNKEVKIEKFYATDEYIEKLNEGLGMGASIGSVAPRLNYDISGWHRGNLSILGSFSGNGKAQPLSSKVLCKDGFKNMGDISLGEQVFGEDGNLHNVIGIFPQGEKEVYKITFSDGSSAISCKEHLWNIQLANKRGYKPNEYETLTLEDIMKIPKYLIGKDGYKKKNIFIPMTNPIEFEHKEIPLDAYILGLLIGDGGFRGTQIDITNSEEDIIKYIENNINKNIVLYKNIKIKNTYRFTDLEKPYKYNRIKKIISELGLLNKLSYEKYIPDLYKYNSSKVRLEILRGLIDTDGEVINSGYVFSSTSKQLSEDVIFLVQSLGGTAKMSERQTSFTYKGEKKNGRVSYRLSIKMPIDIQIYKSKKHENKFKIGQTKARRSIENIEYIGKEICQCILVDNPSHLYLTDNFIVTHNTSWCTANTVLPLVEQGYQYTIISNEQVKEEFLNSVMVHILATKFKEFGITRKRLLVGKFNPSEILQLKKAQSYINEHIAPLLNFVKLFEYDIAETKKIIKKLSNEGCGYFLFDTFKAEDSADDNARGLMVEYSKELFQLASKLNVHILMTQQLAIYMENTRYLTSACLSASKQVKEVADVVILMRQSWDDELDGEKFDVKPYNYMKDSNGKYIKDDKGRNIKEYFTLSEDDRNMLVFLDKNRWGEDKKTYVYTFGGAWNVWKEKGYCHVHTKNRF